jgi:hypothetical protein
MMELEIFIPHDEIEKENCQKLEQYLNSMFFC